MKCYAQYEWNATEESEEGEFLGYISSEGLCVFFYDVGWDPVRSWKPDNGT